MTTPAPTPKRRRRRMNLSPQEKQRRADVLRNAGYIGGGRSSKREGKEKRDAEFAEIRDRLGKCDIIEFATRFLKLSLEGFPFLELFLRCSEGLPLPEGTVKTFVEVPSDAFAVEEVEMTWPEYFALCSCGSEVYRPGKKPYTVGARVGRRSGKSTAGAIKALYYGTRPEFRDYVRENEVIRIPILATSEDQAQAIITQRCHEVLSAAGMEWLIGAMDKQLHLSQVTNDTVPLVCGTEISAFPCNSRKVRGEAAPLVVLDEYPHFSTEGKKQDSDIRSAATGAQGQFPGCQELLLGTPLAEQGDFYNTEQQAQTDDGILFFHAPSWTAAPLLYRNNPDYYHAQFRKDPDLFTREFRAEYAKTANPMYRDDDVVACMILPAEVPPNPSCRYGAGLDQSGLTGKDGFSLCINYYDPARDVCGSAWRKSWNTKDLDLIMAEARVALKRYNIHELMRDRYAGGWVDAAFAKEGITTVSSPPASELHMELNRLLIGRKQELPVDNTLKEALLQTQRVVSKSNNISINHPRDSKGHGDDVEALVRANHQAVSGNWMRREAREDEQRQRERQQREEDSYDPLTYGRV